MSEIDAKHFHKIYGEKTPRITYQKKDGIDYTLMCLVCVLVIYFSYGADLLIAKIGIVISILMIPMFFFRHGVEFSVPAIIRQPLDIIYLFVYKFQNLTFTFFFALGLLLLENYLIKITPTWPHKVELMRTIAIYAFYIHFICITGYRTIILVAHLQKKDLVHEILMQSSWKGFISKQPSIVQEIFQAYFTGIWCHIIFLAPWYLIITHFNFSIIFLPVVVILNFVTEFKYLHAHHNDCFYRDHWLGHNSEIDFLYLHGVHHDAIPSALIAVGENGPLEGFFRQSIGFPTVFYNPVSVFIFYSIEVQQDMFLHQYIPGIYPQLRWELRQAAQHSTHHYHRIEPYSLAAKINQPQFSPEFIKSQAAFGPKTNNAIKLDEELTGFEWDNSRHKWFLDLCAKYDKWDREPDVKVQTQEEMTS